MENSILSVRLMLGDGFLGSWERNHLAAGDVLSGDTCSWGFLGFQLNYLAVTNTRQA